MKLQEKLQTVEDALARMKSESTSEKLDSLWADYPDWAKRYDDALSSIKVYIRGGRVVWEAQVQHAVREIPPGGI